MICQICKYFSTDLNCRKSKKNEYISDRKCLHPPIANNFRTPLIYKSPPWYTDAVRMHPKNGMQINKCIRGGFK